MVTHIKVLGFKDYIAQFDGRVGWAKSFFARAYYEPNSGSDDPKLNPLNLPPRTIVVLKGCENSVKLLVHEYGHVIGLEHPGNSDVPANFIKGAINRIVSAAKAGWPTMSAWWILRWKDTEGLIPKWQAEEKVYI